MTSISGLIGGLIHPHRMHAHGERMQSMLQSAVKSGAVPASDQTALSSALGDIGTALRGGASSTASGASVTDTGDTTSMKDKIDGLIDKEVTDGKLSTNQASELKDLFAKTAAAMAAGGGADASTSASSSSSSSGKIGDAIEGVASDAIGALTHFLDRLKGASKSSSLYGASGSTASKLASVLVNAIA